MRVPEPIARTSHLRGNISPDDRRTLNVYQAAESAGVVWRTIYYWMEQNKVEWYRTPFGVVRIVVESLPRQAA